MNDTQKDAANIESTESTYEAPAVESVLSAEEMEREILYAGNVIYNDGVPN
jgi:hypothetical protein